MNDHDPADGTLLRFPARISGTKYDEEAIRDARRRIPAISTRTCGQRRTEYAETRARSGSAAHGESVEGVDAGLGRSTIGWMDNSEPGPAVSGVVVTTQHVLRLAIAGYLARFKGQSRIHNESDLCGYLAWCDLRGLDPWPRPAPHRAVSTVAAGSAPAPAIDGVPPDVGGGRVPIGPV
jgi:hypothetical protein